MMIEKSFSEIKRRHSLNDGHRFVMFSDIFISSFLYTKNYKLEIKNISSHSFNNVAAIKPNKHNRYKKSNFSKIIEEKLMDN